MMRLAGAFRIVADASDGTPAVPDVSHSSTLYVIAVIGAALVLGLTVFTNVWERWGKFMDNRRRAADARDDARVVDLTKDVRYLKNKTASQDERITELEAWKDRTRNNINNHMLWDFKAHHGVKTYAPPEFINDLGDPPHILPEGE